MGKIDIHGYERRLELAIRGIKRSNLPDTTIRLFIEFSDYCMAEGLAIPTTVKHLFCLRNAARWTQKDFDKTNKDDIIKIVGKLERSKYSDEVKHATKVSLKKFYKWLNGGEDYPDNVKWIKSAQKSKKKLPEELLTSEDVQKMIIAAEHPRDKALISILYESGCRIGEVLSLRLKNIEFDEHGAKIMVDGKTGMRMVILMSSVPFLATLIDNHPRRNDPESPLWLGIGTNNRNKVIRYANAAKTIRILAKKAGIKKRVNPHLFRHSRATHMANHLTEAQMNYFFGWVQGSDMPSTYVHLSGRDVLGAILKMNGFEKEENEEKKNEFSPKMCHRCEKVNPPTGKFCNRCGTPLDLETVLQVEEKRKEVDVAMNTLIKDPEVLNLLAKKMKEMNLSLDAQSSVK